MRIGLLNSVFRRFRERFPATLLVLAIGGIGASQAATPAPPRVLDDALAIDLFAAEPDIVTPVSLDVDENGRVWVIESHTHQTPPNYRGPSSDRILVFEDLDRDGHADRRTRFAEGFRHAMGIDVRPDGAVWLATRREILRLEDTVGDGVADRRSTVAYLETEGDYPHNGLSGFAFDERGHVFFGIGENLGVAWRLVARDGGVLEGGTEGGDIFRMREDGSELERWATGFWNPFGLELDAFGRLWAVDNDPDSRPPCRLLHVIRGGDYGYRFWLGRAGLHPFTSWNGNLPGTLPMAAGTGEAPSGIVAYEHDAFGDRFHGALLATSWGDHRIDLFRPESHGASFRSAAEPIVAGDDEFRPVGIALARDGTVFVSDWVDVSYPVHGRGRIWRLRRNAGGSSLSPSPEPSRSDGERAPDPWARASRFERRGVVERWLGEHGDDPSAAAALVGEALSGHTEAIGRRERLVAVASGSEAVRQTLDGAFRPENLGAVGPEVSASLLRALFEGLPPGERGWVLDTCLALAASDATPAELRLEALHGLAASGELPRGAPALDLIALAAQTNDLFLASASLHAATRLLSVEELETRARAGDPRTRLFALTALRRVSGMGRGFVPFGEKRRVTAEVVRRFLADPDPAVRRAAVQWVGEEDLRELRDALDAAIRGDPDGAIVDAWAAAVELLEGKPANERDKRSRAERLWRLATNDSAPAAARAQALRALDPAWPDIEEAACRRLSAVPELALPLVRTVRAAPADWAESFLVEIASAPQSPRTVRREAVIGLSRFVDRRRDYLVRLLEDSDGVIAREAAKILGSSGELSPALALRCSELRAEPPAAPPRGTDAWRSWLLDGGDPGEGEVLFFHPVGPRCATCHTVRGRGGPAGPDLSRIGERPPEAILEAILEPARDIARGFEPWVAVTPDGGAESGVLLGEDAAGQVLFGTATGAVRRFDRTRLLRLERGEGSVMPDDLEAALGDRELRDLVAFLRSLR